MAPDFYWPCLTFAALSSVLDCCFLVLSSLPMQLILMWMGSSSWAALCAQGLDGGYPSSYVHVKVTAHIYLPSSQNLGSWSLIICTNIGGQHIIRLKQQYQWWQEWGTCELCLFLISAIPLSFSYISAISICCRKQHPFSASYSLVIPIFGTWR